MEEPLDVGEEGLGILQGWAGAGEEMPLESGKRAAPAENGGALSEIRRCQLVAAEELATKQTVSRLKKLGWFLGQRSTCVLWRWSLVFCHLVGVDLG
jgi:hypothetical protein